MKHQKRSLPINFFYYLITNTIYPKAKLLLKLQTIKQILIYKITLLIFKLNHFQFPSNANKVLSFISIRSSSDKSIPSTLFPCPIEPMY